MASPREIGGAEATGRAEEVISRGEPVAEALEKASDLRTYDADLRANPNIRININYIYGFNDHQPQHWVNQNLYVILWLGALWLVFFLPTHLALRRIFAVSPPTAGLKLPIRCL